MLDTVHDASPAIPRPAGRASAPSAQPIRARLHPDLTALEHTWRHAEAAGHATAFQLFDWLRLVRGIVAGPAGTETFGVELSDPSGRPAMLLAFSRRRHRGVVTLSLLDGGVCDYLAPVICPGARLPPPTELWATIRRVLPPADLVTIPKMPAAIAGAANPLLALPNVRAMATKRYGLPISGPAEDLLRRTTRHSTFRDLAKFKRRLAKRGAVAFTVAADADEVEAIADAMFAQRRDRFREMGRENLMDRPEIERLYREAARDGLAGGPVRICGLSVDGEWVATAYGLVRGGSFALVAQTMAGGEWRNCSPGILASAATMEWAAARGMTYFDFTIGLLPYKLELGAVAEPLYEFAHALTWRGAAALAATRALGGAKAALQRRSRLFALAQAARRRLRRL